MYSKSQDLIQFVADKIHLGSMCIFYSGDLDHNEFDKAVRLAAKEVTIRVSDERSYDPALKHEDWKRMFGGEENLAKDKKHLESEDAVLKDLAVVVIDDRTDDRSLHKSEEWKKFFEKHSDSCILIKSTRSDRLLSPSLRQAVFWLISDKGAGSAHNKTSLILAASVSDPWAVDERITIKIACARRL